MSISNFQSYSSLVIDEETLGARSPSLSRSTGGGGIGSLSSSFSSLPPPTPPLSPSPYPALPLHANSINDGGGGLGEGDGRTESARLLEEGIIKPKPPLHFPSLLCIMSIGFIANCEYGVVMPSIWTYMDHIGGTKTELGIAIAACSFWQLCFLPIFGYWSDRRTIKETIMFAMIVGIIGNIVYASADYLGSPTYIIMGRALVGVYMGIISTTNSFVALVTTPETRTKFMAQINGINALGLVAGPGFNIFLSKLNFSMGPWKVDANTSPGWFVACLVTLSFICYLLFFKEPQAPPPKKQEMRESTSYGAHKSEVMTAGRYLWFVANSFSKPYGACFIICFVQNFDFAVLETITTPLTAQWYGFGPFKNSIFYSALSVEMVVVIFVTATLSRMKVQDRYILLFAQTCVGVGVVGMLVYYGDGIPLWKMATFAAILVAGIPSQNISVMSTYSKLLTAEFGQAKQGLYTGIIMIFGSLARILGPLWGGVGLEFKNIKILFGLLVAIWGLDVIFTLAFFKKLKPMTVNESDERVSLLAH